MPASQAGRRGFDPHLPLLESVVCGPPFSPRFPFLPLSAGMYQILVNSAPADAENRRVTDARFTDFVTASLGALAVICSWRSLPAVTPYWREAHNRQVPSPRPHRGRHTWLW